MAPKVKNKIPVDFGTINLKSYAYKLLSYWKLLLLSVVIALSFAKYKNMMSIEKYNINTLITIDEKSNPLLSSSTNISFNWGGASNAVETVRSKFKSRTHTEKVVNDLEFYINYFKQEKILFKKRMRDVYGKVPFKVSLAQKNSYQLINKEIGVNLISNDEVEISIDFGDPLESVKLYNYQTSDIKRYYPNNRFYKNVFNISKNNIVVTPFLQINFEKIIDQFPKKQFYISFSDFNSTVSHYTNIKISTAVKGTSLLRLGIEGVNKNRLIDYLNKTVEVLEQVEKQTRILYAVNTKKFVDSLFQIENNKLEAIEQKLISFKVNNSSRLSDQGQKAYDNIFKLREEIKLIQKNTELLLRIKNNSLSNDLEVNNIPLNELNDIGLSKQFTELFNYLMLKEKLIINDISQQHPDFVNLESQILTSKRNIKNRLGALINYNGEKVKSLRRDVFDVESSISDLPIREHELLHLEKNYALTEGNYNNLKQRSYDAGAAIAANSSTIQIIDPAKDYGQKPLASKNQFNYIVAILLAIILPLIFITIIEILDDYLYTVEQLEEIYNIPVLGVIGKNSSKSSLVLIDNPNSSTAESFRAIRSSLSYMFVEKPGKTHKTILNTSSIGGEGKTLTSINIASAYAISGKKTVLLGFDLRKPKIYNDFNVSNEKGLVNHLVGQMSLEDVTINSYIDNLDLILSGPIPPNPSELILGDTTQKMFKELEDKYDYIIIDTPPVGLVPDALDLMKYSDVNIYITRQGYTKKGMMRMIDQKYINGEVKNINFILNDYTQSSKYQLRYGYGYGQGYGYGYGGYSYGYHSDDKPSLWIKVKNIFKKKS